VADWQEEQNERQASVKWQFTTAKAASNCTACARPYIIH
jgi:hypothetical protein